MGVEKKKRFVTSITVELFIHTCDRHYFQPIPQGSWADPALKSPSPTEH